MKASKDAVSAARRLFNLCVIEGRLNEDVMRKVIKGVTEKKPRNYLGILQTLKKLVRAELARHHVIVESAEPLDAVTTTRVESDILAEHGSGLTFEYLVTPELLGGIRIRKGDDVWDGSLKSKLDRLANTF